MNNGFCPSRNLGHPSGVTDGEREEGATSLYFVQEPINKTVGGAEPQRAWISAVHEKRIRAH
jgi:hypothetical protein